jgi:LPS-assembly lipoprotein
MWWRERRTSWRRLSRLAVALAAASLTAGCFEPLYGSRPSIDTETVHDKLAAVEIAPIPASKGQPVARLAVALRNNLQYSFNGAAGPNAPTYRLNVNISTTVLSVNVDITSGRPDAQVDSVAASYQLTEIATGKIVISDTTFAHVDFDIPGSAQRFAAARAQRNAEDRATAVVADTIRNRLASYFVAGT